MADDDTTRIITRRSNAIYDDATTPLEGARAAQGTPEDDPHTKIFRPKSPASAAPAALGSAATVTEFAEEPVVGWLVVVEGPGKGKSVKLGYGMNSIGRGAEERVSLDFGDEEISRHAHAMLTYDAKGRKFYIQHGGGTNLTYLGESPVLQPHEIKGKEIIGLGKTQLCFIPFCGPDFEW
jgi:hypothetical protein